MKKTILTITLLGFVIAAAPAKATTYVTLDQYNANLQAARDFALITTNSYTSVLKKYQATVTAGAATQQGLC